MIVRAARAASRVGRGDVTVLLVGSMWRGRRVKVGSMIWVGLGGEGVGGSVRMRVLGEGGEDVDKFWAWLGLA